ncbi:MAG: hypothetical protein LBI98_00490 [Endomicrobium sp.]|nr:hypothetical protein [Endomicrobium sp.]
MRFFLSLLITFLNDMKFDIFLVMFCSSVLAMTNMQNTRRRADLISIGFKALFAKAIAA